MNAIPLRHLICLVAFALSLVGAGAALRQESVHGAAVAAGPQQVEVIRAIDGDTLEIRRATGTERSVRLIGIDTPETVRPGTPVECGGPAASKAAGRFVGSPVRLVVDPTQDRVDRYGRLLRYIVTDSGVDVGRKLIAGGHAAVYIYDNEFQRLPPYTSAADTARERGRGVWGGCDGDFHRPK